MPRDYSQPFTITGPIGNNALSFERRGAAPTLHVPSLIEGTFADVQPGVEIVFEDFDEHDVLQSCKGLVHLVRTTWRGVPTVVMDNHNHAFYFWQEAIERGVITPGAVVVHIDQHRDTRVPERMFDGASLASAFDYTNLHLNVGNYIVPAQHAGMVSGVQFVTSGEALNERSFVPRTNKILNIDLDFFAPEMSYIDRGAAMQFIAAHLKNAALVTIATSPFFIDQRSAIALLRELALRMET